MSYNWNKRPHREGTYLACLRSSVALATVGAIGFVGGACG